MTHLRRSNLFILPLNCHSPLFGTEVLSAVAAGVPVLVSQDSGIASLLQKIAQDDSVVRESSFVPQSETWTDKILQKLLNPEQSERHAIRMREELLLDTGVAETHLSFIKTITGEVTIDIVACLKEKNANFSNFNNS